MGELPVAIAMSITSLSKSTLETKLRQRPIRIGCQLVSQIPVQLPPLSLLRMQLSFALYPGKFGRDELSDGKHNQVRNLPEFPPPPCICGEITCTDIHTYANGREEQLAFSSAAFAYKFCHSATKVSLS